jgi:hypothetical protein
MRSEGKTATEVEERKLLTVLCSVGHWGRHLASALDTGWPDENYTEVEVLFGSCVTTVRAVFDLVPPFKAFT